MSATLYQLLAFEGTNMQTPTPKIPAAKAIAPKTIMTKAMLINGQAVFAQSERTYPLYNPANGELLANIADGGKTETELAIAAAKAAFPAWSKLPVKQRGELMRRAETLIKEHADEIARLITLENGKPLAEAKQEVLFASGYLGWFAEEGRRASGEWVPSPFPHKRLLTTTKPLGVVGAVTPWNFPANMITRKIAPAIAAGCTVVLKPADSTPLTALRLGEILLEAGIPAGVFNIVTAKDPTPVGDALVNHPDVRMITFTGSVRVGKLLAEQALKSLKRVSLELGGNAPVLVFDDANLTKAVKEVAAIKFLRVGGESCICANRIYVHESIYDNFVTAFTDEVAKLSMGDGFTEGVRLGPLITAQALARVTALVDETKQLGGRITLGGHRLEGTGVNPQGHFYAPTVIADCQDEWPIAQQEIFGPVACLYKFRDEEEVYARANNTIYGLAAYVFSQNMARILRALEALEYGFIGVNDGEGYTHEIPVGGFKSSGIGREGGREGLWEYLETQSAVINLA